MDERAKNQSPLTMKSLQERITTQEADFAARLSQLQERIATMEVDFAARLSQFQERIAALEADFAVKYAQLEQKHGLLYEAHQQLQQDFEAYKNIHPLKKLLGKAQEK
jgi:hypothetical protein